MSVLCFIGQETSHVSQAMAKKELSLLALFYLMLGLLTSKGRCDAQMDDELVNVLKDARDGPAALFSGAFKAVTVFGCRGANGRLELLRRFSRVFVSSSVIDIGESDRVLAEIAWATGYKNEELPSDAHRLLFVLDLDCLNADEFIYKANREMMFAAPFKWLILQQSNNTDELLSMLVDADIFPDSDVSIWQQDLNKVLSIYKMNANSSYRIEDRGYLTPNKNQIMVKNRDVTSRRRRNLAGTQLKSCIVITDPDTINHLTDFHDRHIDSITKCNYPWALHLVNMLNATVTFERVGTWGYQSPNGSWGGMIGMLQRGEIDFGGTGTFLLKERIGTIQYISLSTPTGSKFIFRRPPLSSVSNLFKLPFRDTVWLGICALIVLLVILLYPAMRSEWNQLNDRDRERDPIPPNLSDDLLVILGAVSQQGSWYEPRSVPTRMIVLMALLAALSLYTAYTANIVALLQSTTMSINSLKDLLESPLTLAAHDNVYNRYYFKSFKDPVRRAIYEERIEPRGAKKNNWLAIEDGIERMRQGYFAFHVEPGCAYKIVQETYEEDEKCGFHEIDYLNVFDPHFIVKRRSPYLELLRVGAMRLHESGLRTRELSRLYTKKPICSSARQFLSVGLAECYGAFYTLLFGVVLAFVLFTVELFTKNMRIRCKSSKRNIIDAALSSSPESTSGSTQWR